ncbi:MULTISPECIES: T9SS C-terminal target domain-containing protein [Rhodonellum]|nr:MULTISPECIES: T9SS C-terminal target domain-containing protein [Rhodonellum]SDZ06361.1 gliding motility-associated C-terminal domain-containing protein [Rhodonellum ikkaensis]
MMNRSCLIYPVVPLILFLFGTAGSAYALDRYSICAGESLILNAETNADDYSWFRNGVPITENQSMLLVKEAGIYEVIAINKNGCGSDASDPVEVLVDPIPVLRVNQPAPSCDPTGRVDITAQIIGFDTDKYDYIIKDPVGKILRADELTPISASGEYLVSVAFKGAECYTLPSRVMVYIAEEVMDADYEIEVNGIVFQNDAGYIDAFLGEPIKFLDISVGDPIEWLWDFGDGNRSTLENPVHQYDEKGDYLVTLYVKNDMGCFDEITGIVTVFADYFLKIPNAFTPNREDGKNNYFLPAFRGMAEMEFMIFNTWGDLIFETNSLESRGWDGTLNGLPTPNGNYVYKAKFTSITGEKIVRSGVFILIK